MFVPKIGMEVCDCRYIHQQIIAVDQDDMDTVTLEDGHVCSFHACCDLIPHPGWEHPSTKGSHSRSPIA
jgi:hypothetical protein